MERLEREGVEMEATEGEDRAASAADAGLSGGFMGRFDLSARLAGLGRGASATCSAPTAPVLVLQSSYYCSTPKLGLNLINSSARRPANTRYHDDPAHSHKENIKNDRADPRADAQRRLRPHADPALKSPGAAARTGCAPRC